MVKLVEEGMPQRHVCSTIGRLFGFDTRKCCTTCHEHQPERLFRIAMVLVGAPQPFKDELLVCCCKSIAYMIDRDHGVDLVSFASCRHSKSEVSR